MDSPKYTDSYGAFVPAVRRWLVTAGFCARCIVTAKPRQLLNEIHAWRLD
jgi:hypothetical protein